MKGKKNFQRQDENIQEENIAVPRHPMDVADEIHKLEDQEPKDKRKVKAREDWKERLNRLIDEYNSLKGVKDFKPLR